MVVEVFDAGLAEDAVVHLVGLVVLAVDAVLLPVFLVFLVSYAA